MNQSVIAGIGNVYRAEILFRCSVNPFERGKDLTPEDLQQIWDDSVYLLNDGSRDGRIRTVAFEIISEEEKAAVGKYNGQFSYVYKRTGQKCRLCPSKIEEEKIDGRTVYWCPTCQPLK